jgi:hypothetical protein
LKKKSLLILLVTIFLCACTFVQKEKSKSDKTGEDITLMKQLDDIVIKAEKHAEISESTEVKEVFQDQIKQVWKIHFMNGTIVLYDERTGEFVKTE